MEIPDFCTRRSVRVKRKRKTEEETDPDWGPSTGNNEGDEVVAEASSSSLARSSGGGKKGSRGRGKIVDNGLEGKKPWEERSKVVKSKALAERTAMAKPELNFIERPEYTIEDWKLRMVEAQKEREETKRKEQRKRRQLKSKEKEKTTTGTSKRALKKVGRKKKKMDDDDDEMDSEDDERCYNLLAPIETELDECTKYMSKKITPENFDLKNLPNWILGLNKGEKDGAPKHEFGSIWERELEPFVAGVEQDPRKMFPWNYSDPSVPDFEPIIVSMVATFSVGQTLDLRKIAESTRNVEYNPDRCAPLIMRTREPKCTGLIFKSGRIILTGITSEEDARLAARKFARVIQRQGMSVRMLNYRIQNVAAQCRLDFKVKLNELSQNKLYGHLSYEPELFPGLIIPLDYPRVKIIIFCSGSVLLTGAKSVADVKEAFLKVYPLIKLHAP